MPLFCKFEPTYTSLGPTGIDRLGVVIVSMPGQAIDPVKLGRTILIGEFNYSLAA